MADGGGVGPNGANPLLTGYRCANEEWIWLLGLEGDGRWPNIATALELDDLRDDRRFATMEGRRDHATEVTGQHCRSGSAGAAASRVGVPPRRYRGLVGEGATRP